MVSIRRKEEVKTEFAKRGVRFNIDDLGRLVIEFPCLIVVNHCFSSLMIVRTL